MPAAGLEPARPKGNGF